MLEHQSGSTAHAVGAHSRDRRIRSLARVSIGCVGVFGMSLLSAVSGHAQTAPSATVCELQAVASIDPPGLTTTSSTFTYNLFGQLISSFNPTVNGCASSDPAAPTGTPSWDAGNAAIVRISGTDASGPWFVDYALPQSTGVGSCAESTSQGTALAQWPDGTMTVFDYATVGVGSAWLIDGSVVGQATLTETDFSGTPPAGTPTTFAATTNNPSFPVGATLSGQVAFIDELADPTCSGTTFAGFTGMVEIGNS